VSEMIDAAGRLGVDAVSAEHAAPVLAHGQVMVASLRAAIRNLPHVECLVLHDAEQCARELVAFFSLQVPSYAYLYQELCRLFGSICQKQAGYVLDVPSARWIELAEPVRQLMHDYKDLSAFAERLRFLEDIFDSCHCRISETAITLSATKIPRRKLGVFASAPQRIFMALPGADHQRIVDVFDIQT